MEDEEWMAETLDVARKAMENNEVPIASILVVDGEEVARSQTRVTRDDRTAAHAEMLTILEAGNFWNYEGEKVLYTSLQPCIMCLSAAIRCDIDRIVYAAEAGNEASEEDIDLQN